jgi:proliferating cell nuclear antigen
VSAQEAAEREAFDAVIDVSAFQDFLDVPLSIVDEAMLQFGPDGFRIHVVESANVAFVDLSLSSEAFESFDAGEGSVGVNLSRLSTIVGHGRGDLVELSLDLETGTLGIERGPMSTSMALIDPENVRDAPEDPDIDLEGYAVIRGEDFSEAIAGCSDFADHVEILVDPDEGGFELVSEGDIDDIRYRFVDELVEVGTEHRTALFSLDYLGEIKPVVPDDADVAVRFDDEMPLRMTYRLNEDVPVEWLVAPRIRK